MRWVPTPIGCATSALGWISSDLLITKSPPLLARVEQVVRGGPLTGGGAVLLPARGVRGGLRDRGLQVVQGLVGAGHVSSPHWSEGFSGRLRPRRREIGRASCRER